MAGRAPARAAINGFFVSSRQRVCVLTLTDAPSLADATDNPNFRGYWFGGNKVFFNALLFGKAIRPVRAVLGDEAEDEDAHE